MKHLQSVLIRSTTGWFEPRFKSAEASLVELLGPTSSITWSRTINDERVVGGNAENVFKNRAAYGRGWRNTFHHLAFFFFVVRRLRLIQPRIIYACDLDTLVPSLFWRRNKKCLIIYDQFDPLSAKTQNKVLSILFDKFEYKISKFSNIQITANKLRIPKELRDSWFEIKNIFSIKARSDSAKNREPLILFYGGILGNDRGLLACAEAISKVHNWEFHLYGQGMLSKDLILKNIGNVFIHDPISHEELMNVATKSHLFLAMYDPSFSHNQFTASNKLFEAVQLGLPILTNDGTNIGSIVTQASLGWSVTYNGTSEIIRVLRDFEETYTTTAEGIKRNLLAFYSSQNQENTNEIDRLWIRVHELLRGAV